MTTTLCYSLSLADGTRWLIHAGDPDAARVVTALGEAMQLQPAHPRETSPRTRGGLRGERELLVVVQRGKTPPANLSGPGPAVCTLPPHLNNDLLDINMSHLALAIAREAQSRGGVLVHGALACRGVACDAPTAWGAILAGPGTVGKTTASNRLPPPWRPLCDDASLVVRDATGRYWAHPWPTWSRFHGDGPSGSWDVQHAVPLRAIFFLSQSPDDRAESLHVTQATAMLMETVQHVSRPMTRLLSDDETQALHQEQLAAVENLARAIPAYTLHISLAGEFWREMERVLEDDVSRITHHASSPMPHTPHATSHATVESLLDDGALHMVYTGPSMNPTLAEPDLLEVVPYSDRPVRPGDVVYFDPPEGKREVVHRVVQVSPAGIRTRGDNNPQEDPYNLQLDDIVGQVVMAQRGQRRRHIAGGWHGVLAGRCSRLWRAANRAISRLSRGAYRALAGSSLFRRVLPAEVQPRVLVFQARQEQYFKLVMGRRVIGQYDVRKRQWRIRRPFRLFVDEAGLPVPPEASRRPAEERSRHRHR